MALTLAWFRTTFLVWNQSGHSNETMLKRILDAPASLRMRAQCVILTSFCEFEGDSILTLWEDLPCPAFAVGPCILFMALQEHESNPDGESYMAWLDSQQEGSVPYVPLGSYLSVSAVQLDEIAAGLAESKARLLWPTWEG
jgi:hypothetical protein